MHVTVTVMLRTVTVTNELYFKATVPFYVTYLRSTVMLRTVTVTNKNLRERFALLRDPSRPKVGHVGSRKACQARDVFEGNTVTGLYSDGHRDRAKGHGHVGQQFKRHSCFNNSNLSLCIFYDTVYL